MKQDYYGLLRPEIVEMIPTGCKAVLDVGCGTGALGAYLKTKGVLTAYGIELSHDAACNARKNLDVVIEGNIESADFPFPQARFDCIICADVLEHLVDPWAAVGKLKGLLTPDGMIVASIPNIGYHRIIRALIKGRWRYSDAGILDRTHLRFFTLQGVQELFALNGMELEKVYRKKDAGLNMKLLNMILGNSLRESLVFQYVVRARIAT